MMGSKWVLVICCLKSSSLRVLRLVGSPCILISSCCKRELSCSATGPSALRLTSEMRREILINKSNYFTFKLRTRSNAFSCICFSNLTASRSKPILSFSKFSRCLISMSLIFWLIISWSLISRFWEASCSTW
jgi:hypothetical protein